MDEVLGQRSSTAPPVLTAFIPEDTPGPSDQEEEDEDDEEEESQPAPRRKRRMKRADAAAARERIHSVTARLQMQHPEAFMIISRGFNHVTLDSTLTAFHQVVNLLYANVTEA